MEAGKSFAVRSEITLDNQIENRNDTCRQTKNITHDKQLKVLANNTGCTQDKHRKHQGGE